MKLAWFYAAIPVGSAFLGYAFGETVMRLLHDWAVGLLPRGAALCTAARLLVLPDAGENCRDGGADTGRHARNRCRRRCAIILISSKTPSYVLNTLGMTAMTFALGGLAYWVPKYLEYRQVEPLWGVGPRTAFGGITVLCGLAATLIGGMVGDWLKPRFSGSYFLVSGLALVVACPLLVVMTRMPFPGAWIPLALFVFFLFLNTGPTNAILANVVHPLLRAPGFALNILVIHLFGDAISPPIA